MNWSTLIFYATIYMAVFTFGLASLCQGYLIYALHLSKRKIKLEKIQAWQNRARLPFKFWYFILANEDYNELTKTIININPKRYFGYIVLGMLLTFACLSVLIFNFIGSIISHDLRLLFYYLFLLFILILGTIRTIFLLRLR